jgi:hypothetical protein
VSYHFLKNCAPTEYKIDDVKDSFYEELERVSKNFLKFYVKILLGDFKAKGGREDTFKMKIVNSKLHEISNDHGVRVLNFATSKNLTVKLTRFPDHNIHKYTWMSPGGRTDNQIIPIQRQKRRSFECI